MARPGLDNSPLWKWWQQTTLGADKMQLPHPPADGSLMHECTVKHGCGSQPNPASIYRAQQSGLTIELVDMSRHTPVFES